MCFIAFGNQPQEVETFRGQESERDETAAGETDPRRGVSGGPQRGLSDEGRNHQEIKTLNERGQEINFKIFYRYGKR